MNIFKKTLQLNAVIVIIAFLVGLIIPLPSASAKSLLNLPAPGTMVTMSPAFIPPLVRGIKMHPDDPLKFIFFIDAGDKHLQGEDLKAESTKLIKYFLASLTVPENEMWVNLSPYEKNRIIPKDFGKTAMGRDLLAQDYMLKQLTASLMYPENELGNAFWDRVYEKTQQKYGTSEIPTNTFNKVWIVPDKAAVYVNETSVFVAKSHLKVMLEEDYLALEANKVSVKHGLGNTKEEDLRVVSGVSSKILKKIIIPEIEREINEGKTFAPLRQIYNSSILATWYKQNLKSSLLGQKYINQGKTLGIEIHDKEVNQKIYNQYIDAFQRGVFNFIKEDYDPSSERIIPRKYFSGGAVIGKKDVAILSEKGKGAALRQSWKQRPINEVSWVGEDVAMLSDNANPPKPKLFLRGHSHTEPQTIKTFAKIFLDIQQVPETKGLINKPALEINRAMLEGLLTDIKDGLNRYHKDIKEIKRILSDSNNGVTALGLEISEEEFQEELAALEKNYTFILENVKKLGIENFEKITKDVFLLVYGPEFYLFFTKDPLLKNIKMVALEKKGIRKKTFELNDQYEDIADQLNTQTKGQRERESAFQQWIKFNKNFIIKNQLPSNEQIEENIKDFKDAVLIDRAREGTELMIRLLRLAGERDRHMAEKIKSLKENIIYTVGRHHTVGLKNYFKREGHLEVIDVSATPNNNALPTLENLGGLIRDQGFEAVVKNLSEIPDLTLITGEIFDRQGNNISLDQGKNLMANDAKAYTDGVNAAVDEAMVGGIDLNPNIYDLDAQGSHFKWNMKFDPQQIQNINLNGIVPMITHIKPVESLSLILGVAR